MFPKKLRKAVAEELRDQFETEYKIGNYDDFVPKKYQPKPDKPARVTARRTTRKSTKYAGAESRLGGMK